MIRIEAITIREFRGIRDLTLKMDGRNFAACGPNGTGKSGIVDAIEFARTGSISRLSGAGTGGLSVKAHGPHLVFYFVFARRMGPPCARCPRTDRQ